MAFSGRFKKSRAGKRRSRKRVARRTKRRNPTRNISGTVKMGLGFPKKVIVTHKYTQNFQLASTLGIVGSTNFSCNSLFKPDQTGTGHQPMYRDQYQALYDHYTVIGSKIRIKFCNTATANVSGRFIILQQDDTSLASVNTDALSEASLAKWKMIATGDNNVHTLTKSWSAKKTFGGSILGNDNLQGTASTSPAEQSIYTLAYAANTAVTQSIDVIVEIDYIAVWDELIELGSS